MKPVGIEDFILEAQKTKVLLDWREETRTAREIAKSVDLLNTKVLKEENKIDIFDGKFEVKDKLEIENLIEEWEEDPPAFQLSRSLDDLGEGRSDIDLIVDCILKAAEAKVRLSLLGNGEGGNND